MKKKTRPKDFSPIPMKAGDDKVIAESKGFDDTSFKAGKKDRRREKRKKK
jgi:hypothetical protein